MRALTHEEMDLVAGGDDFTAMDETFSKEEMPEVTITGTIPSQVVTVPDLVANFVGMAVKEYCSAAAKTVPQKIGCNVLGSATASALKSVGVKITPNPWFPAGPGNVHIVMRR